LLSGGDRLLPLDVQHTQMDPAVVGPANGFIETYLAQCNYLGVEVTASTQQSFPLRSFMTAVAFIQLILYRRLQPNNQLVQFICDLWAKHITELNLTLCPGTCSLSVRLVQGVLSLVSRELAILLVFSSRPVTCVVCRF
jgi:hypothetical protein